MNRIFSLLILLFGLSIILIDCKSIFIYSINDKRIPKEVLDSLNQLRFDSSGSLDLKTSSQFINKKWPLIITIERQIELSDSGKSTLKYSITNNPYPELEIRANPAVNRVTSTQSLITEALYVCTHKDETHQTLDPSQVPVLTKQFNCPSWKIVYRKRN
jgi:hypothetical protein